MVFIAFSRNNFSELISPISLFNKNSSENAIPLVSPTNDTELDKIIFLTPSLLK